MKEMVKIVDNTKKHPEDRQYLICIRSKSGAQDIWEIVLGRTEAYEYIKENIDDINLEHSFILVESLPLEKRASIYAFMKHVESLYLDNFDIEDYVKGDWDETDYRRNNDIGMEINKSERIGIESFMNNEIDIVELK